ncbi:putative short-chain dehydrogenase/reductase SDR, NAD(P)-binding domain superfamily [Helianthus annuus]|nr:putative short-chain dehydrogenase/reductase SDR, NAD(P)-binding domain superfamily [Helianthus annuus]
MVEDSSNDERLEENLAKIALHLGRYIVTMMSTGVILLIVFSLSGGDGQMNDLVWYSWVGGIIIGTMIGSSMVLDEVSRAGPRNVVITGSTRGLGKALAREFLLFGDRVVIAARSEKSDDLTIKELEENLQEGMATWLINNAGTNKGFRPLLEFRDEDIQNANIDKDQMKAAIKAQQDQQIDNALLAEA